MKKPTLIKGWDQIKMRTEDFAPGAIVVNEARVQSLLEQQAKLTRTETLAKALESIDLPSEVPTTYKNASTLMRHRIKNLLQLSK